VRFDLDKMSWIGSPSEQPQVLWAWHTSPFRSFDDTRRETMTLGATSPTADNYFTPKLAEVLLGGKFHLISGYKAVQDIFLAAERGEVHGNSTPLSGIMLGRADDFKASKIRVLAQFGVRRLPELPDVPTGIELATDEESRTLLEFWAMKFRAAYPIALPPEVPKDRVMTLQAAFDALMKDKTFRDFSQKVGLDLSPVSGPEIQEIIRSVNVVSEDRIAKIRAALSK
jgi:tripartite-type tricarboxylate transporter receptor subunit TctC